MKISHINVGKDFSRYPVGRYLAEGNSNGQKFREEFLSPSLKAGRVKVFMDDAFGYGSSFLEEAFGGLIRCGFDKKILKDNLFIVTDDESLSREIWNYIEDADKRKNRG